MVADRCLRCWSLPADEGTEVSTEGDAGAGTVQGLGYRQGDGQGFRAEPEAGLDLPSGRVDGVDAVPLFDARCSGQASCWPLQFFGGEPAVDLPDLFEGLVVGGGVGYPAAITAVDPAVRPPSRYGLVVVVLQRGQFFRPVRLAAAEADQGEFPFAVEMGVTGVPGLLGQQGVTTGVDHLGRRHCLATAAVGQYRPGDATIDIAQQAGRMAVEEEIDAGGDQGLVAGAFDPQRRRWRSVRPDRLRQGVAAVVGLLRPEVEGPDDVVATIAFRGGEQHRATLGGGGAGAGAGGSAAADDQQVDGGEEGEIAAHAGIAPGSMLLAKVGYRSAMSNDGRFSA